MMSVMVASKPGLQRLLVTVGVRAVMRNKDVSRIARMS